MKKLTALLLSFCAALSLSGCGGSTETVETGPTVVRIGIFEPLTGADAKYGEAEKLGIEYAHSLQPTVRVGGKDIEVELVPADNAGSVTYAADAAKTLIAKDVAVVLGSYGDAVSRTAGPVFENAGVAAIAMSCTDRAVTADNDYYFSIASAEELQASALGRYAANRLGARNIYCMGLAGDELSVRRINAFAAAFEAQGGKVMYDFMSPADPDVVTNLVKGYNQGAHAYFAPLDAESIVNMVTLSRSLDIYLPILGPDTLDDDRLIAIPVDETSDAPAIRVYVSGFYAAGGNAAFDAGLREYAGYDPEAEDPGMEDPVSSYAALGYDAYNLALKAITSIGSVDKADILAVMPSVIYTGVTGKLYFDEDGAVIRDAVYVKRADYVNGEWRLDRRQSGGDT